MRVFVEGVGIVGPGLADWTASRPVLAGEDAYRPGPTVVTPSELLPAAERRRAPVAVRLALAAGQDAFRNAGRDVASTATVFASSSSDGDTLHQMCETLATAEREVSPTRFHNSVHNAAAGYWSIATRCRKPSTSLGCYDASFAAGLLEAAVQVAVGRVPVGLIAYDQPYPEPLHSARSVGASFGTALVLTPESGEEAFAALEIDFLSGPGQATRMSDPALEATRLDNPAARALPLLAALAGKGGGVILDYLSDAHLRIAASPC
jgi:Beta-ketoacyl synthase, N-terminal domain